MTGASNPKDSIKDEVLNGIFIVLNSIGVLFMLVALYVIPKFNDIFNTMEVELPFLSSLLVAVPLGYIVNLAILAFAVFAIIRSMVKFQQLAESRIQLIVFFILCLYLLGFITSVYLPMYNLS